MTMFIFLGFFTKLSSHTPCLFLESVASWSEMKGLCMVYYALRQLSR